MESEGRDQEVARRIGPRLKKELKEDGFEWGQPVFLRIFKEERELELWIQKGEQFARWRTYPIAGISGKLGPKLKEGDRQAPEGFYEVRPAAMNPKSRWHLSFNIGYPNDYDRQLGRTGSFIMVHGNKVSVGCFAMTDVKIEEIYTICDASLKHGQRAFSVHSFPFRMTKERMKYYANHRWYPFWSNLLEGYSWFEDKKVLPKITIHNQRYHFQSQS